MSTPAPVFSGFVNTAGVWSLDHQAQFDAYVSQKFRGCEIVVTVEDKALAKTRLQERGFHAMIAPWVKDGHRYDDLKRALLKEVFSEVEVVNPITGEVALALREPHTSTLSKTKYSELIERTLEIAARCGYVLEAPHEYKERKKKVLREASKREKKARAA